MSYIYVYRYLNIAYFKNEPIGKLHWNRKDYKWTISSYWTCHSLASLGSVTLITVPCRDPEYCVHKVVIRDIVLLWPL